MTKLDIYQKDQKVLSYPLDKDSVWIGRATSNDLILSGERVSRKHAFIERRGDSFWVTDHSSTGTALNGAKIDNAQPLSNNAEIDISDWRLIFHTEATQIDTTELARQTQITKLVSANETRPETQVLKLNPSGKNFKILRPMIIFEIIGQARGQYAVKKRHITIGSGTTCDIVLNDSFVSKNHLELTLTDNGFHAVDLNSTNGTFVNGASIREAFLRANQEIMLGSSRLLISFEKEAEETIIPFSEDIFCGMVGRAPAMKTLFGKILKIATTSMTVLIQAETGSGKELAARAIHDLSERRNKPYIVLNCSAISPHLIESELFGHEKGAFTGADQRRLGAFEQASGGTIFLDEIGELPLELQAKVLRVLEYQNIKRVGSNQEVPIDVRVVAATHRDLLKMMAAHQFREDLFYRLYVLPLSIPPLRERPEDLDALADSFLKKFGQARVTAIDNEAMTAMKTHNWPGNVRELKNALMRAIALCDGNTIRKKDVHIVDYPIYTPPPRFFPSKPVHATAAQPIAPGEPQGENEKDPITPYAEAMRSFEREQIIKAIKLCGGNKDKAAEVLQMGRSTLFRKIKELDITD